MTKDAYPALFHYIQKGMADVAFPATKQEVLDRIGERMVFVDWEKQIPLRTFVEPIASRSFSCAADFYCKLIAAL